MKRPRFVVHLALLGLAFPPVGGRAQDVTVGESALLGTGPTAGVLPKTFARMHPDFPDELRTLPTPGYVIATRYMDASRQILERSASGTHPLFERAVEQSFGRWILTPTRKNRKPQPARLWAPVIFNPKSAAEKARDATPRLLVVTPVFLQKTVGGPVEPFIVKVRLELDAAGTIAAVEPATPIAPPVEEAVRTALAKWKFAPARAAGKPVAASLTMPVVCQPVADDFLRRIPPKPVSRPREGYPAEMSGSGLRAKVVIGFDLDAAGAVRNPVVLTSTHAAFDAASLDSVRQWKYEPATVDGRPVPTFGLKAPFNYDTRAGGRDGFTFYDDSDSSDLPPALRHDTPAKIRGTLDPVYPHALRREGVSGTAKAAVIVDPRGQVRGVKILSADRPEFGRALAAALEGFTFDPALRDGEPVPFLFHHERKFELDAGPRFDSSLRLLALERKNPERILSAAALDGELKPVSRRMPVFPVTLPAGVENGDARVEIIVDEEGYARLPRIVAASDPAFGYAAAQAVSAWRFEPPRKDGKPVAARVELPFSFRPSEAAVSAPQAK